MTYAVGELAEAAGVSVRTLHYYDEIGLLRPTETGENGYRRYDEQAALRLQQVLFYRELGFPLGEIRTMLDQPNFNVAAALRDQRQQLGRRIARLERLIDTIDTTLESLEGSRNMSAKSLFAGFDPAQQEKWEEEVRETYGDTLLRESQRNWGRYSAEERKGILEEGQQIYTALAALVGTDPAAAPTQKLIATWHQHMRNFYEPPLEVLRGHGEMYLNHPEFAALYRAMHPEMPEFLRAAIDIYVDGLEGKG